MTVYPLEAVRTLVLRVQHLDRPNEDDHPSDREEVSGLVEALSADQIDTLQMVHRSHYLVPWSRLGAYDPAVLDQLVYQPGERRLFEGWLHAACLLPLRDYRYQMPLHRHTEANGNRWFADWLQESKSRDLVSHVRQRIEDEGGLRAIDFKDDSHKRGSWWDWKPAKVALEYLLFCGKLMVSNRVNFQRVYDLSERVLPDWVDLTEPSAEERDRYWVEMGARAVGLCDVSKVRDYTKRKAAPSRAIIHKLFDAGVLVKVRARLVDGEIHELVLHRDNLPALKQAAEGALRAERTTFLSPFDSLFWINDRDQAFWGFEKRIEMYTPAAKRKWGYYCLPILHRDCLVGRFDPKLERTPGLLQIKALHLEPGVEPEDSLVAAVAEAMVDFLKFHDATDLVIENSQPQSFGQKLLAAL